MRNKFFVSKKDTYPLSISATIRNSWRYRTQGYPWSCRFP